MDSNADSGPLSVAGSSPAIEQQSPGKFVKPADLFKMRRKSSVANFSSNSISFHQLSPATNSLRKEVVPQPQQHLYNSSSNDGFLSASRLSHPGPFHSATMTNNRRNSGDSPNMSPFKHIEPQSPLKCLKNLADPSPTKNLHGLLRDPFNKRQPVKRRLKLGASPQKSSFSPLRSPVKQRAKMLQLDEDANLEPPKMKFMTSPTKSRVFSDVCQQNDWTLRSQLKIQFAKPCKNWNIGATVTHRRSADFILGLADKSNDNTISTEAIKNVTTFYQHPYMPDLPLFPRITSEMSQGSRFTLTKHNDTIKMIHSAWCESLGDLSALLLDGECPFFYLCSDTYNILFKATPSSQPRRPSVQAYISPFSYGMGLELNKLSIDITYPAEQLTKSGSSASLASATRDCSQASFGSSLNIANVADTDSIQSDQAKATPHSTTVTPSLDSGNYSDLEDENDPNKEDEPEDFLKELGLSQHDLPFRKKREGFIDNDSNTTQTKSKSHKPLAVVEGRSSIRKLIKFLQTNKTYTIRILGKFGCIPPTLLSPREFRLGTPQHPEVVLSQNMIELSQKMELETPATPVKTVIVAGPNFINLKGAILPHSVKELHNLLATSNNELHSCKSVALETSLPFRNIKFA